MEKVRNENPFTSFYIFSVFHLRSVRKNGVFRTLGYSHFCKESLNNITFSTVQKTLTAVIIETRFRVQCIILHIGSLCIDYTSLTEHVITRMMFPAITLSKFPIK